MLGESIINCVNVSGKLLSALELSHMQTHFNFFEVPSYLRVSTNKCSAKLNIIRNFLKCLSKSKSDLGIMLIVFQSHNFDRSTAVLVPESYFLSVTPTRSNLLRGRAYSIKTSTIVQVLFKPFNDYASIC